MKIIFEFLEFWNRKDSFKSPGYKIEIMTLCEKLFKYLDGNYLRFKSVRQKRFQNFQNSKIIFDCLI